MKSSFLRCLGLLVCIIGAAASVGRAQNAVESQSKSAQITEQQNAQSGSAIQSQSGEGTYENLGEWSKQLGNGFGQSSHGGGRSITSRTINGVKEVEVDGRERNVKITDDPDRGIRMEITDKTGEEPKTQTIEAKDVEELKKNHPEAYELYEQYNKPMIPGLPGVEGIEGLPGPFGPVGKALDEVIGQTENLLKKEETVSDEELQAILDKLREVRSRLPE